MDSRTIEEEIILITRFLKETTDEKETEHLWNRRVELKELLAEVTEQEDAE